MFIRLLIVFVCSLIMLIMSCLLFNAGVPTEHAFKLSHDNVVVESVNLLPDPILRVMEASAYNVGVEWQTDNDPCIGAYGDNLCDMVENNFYVVASNYFRYGQIINVSCPGTSIDDQSFIVMDTMNSRYKNNIDIAFPSYAIKEAKDFGRKQCIIKFLP